MVTPYDIKLALSRKLHLFLGKSTKTAANRVALFDSHTRQTVCRPFVGVVTPVTPSVTPNSVTPHSYATCGYATVTPHGYATYGTPSLLASLHRATP